MKAHESIMRAASVILLWAAIILFVIGFAVPIALTMEPTNPYSSDSGMTLLKFLQALHGGLSTASLPFIGSAVVWFMQNGRSGAQ